MSHNLCSSMHIVILYSVCNVYASQKHFSCGWGGWVHHHQTLFLPLGDIIQDIQ